MPVERFLAAYAAFMVFYAALTALTALGGSVAAIAAIVPACQQVAPILAAARRDSAASDVVPEFSSVSTT